MVTRLDFWLHCDACGEALDCLDLVTLPQTGWFVHANCNETVERRRRELAQSGPRLHLVRKQDQEAAQT